MFAAAALSAAAAAAPVAPARFSSADPGVPPAAWKLVTLPKIARHTQFSIVERDGARVLRVEADGSYANLVHRFDPAADASRLSWRWRVDTLRPGTDITRKDGDDLPARVCVLFDLPLARLSLGDRMAVAMGRALFDPDLPAASICYVWDAHVAAGTWLANAYTARVMMLVLRQGVATAWQEERRNLHDDFARAFPREAGNGPWPRIAAVAVSADGDNTGARSLAFVGDVELAAQ